MQDLLKKIVEMDEQARKIEQQANSEKIRSEQEVEELREKIYNDYIVRARERVEKNIAVDREHADQRLEAFRTETAEKQRQMHQLLDEHKQAWVDEIVRRALS